MHIGLILIMSLLALTLTGCGGKSSDTVVQAGQPSEIDAQKVLESKWSYIKWSKFQTVSLDQQSVAGVKTYVLKFKAEGVCVKAGKGCQSEGDRVEWREGVFGFEKNAGAWQPSLPRGEIVKIGA